RRIRSSAGKSPRSGVITRTPAIDSGGRANRVAYASFPRKYRPLRKENTSPIGMPDGERSLDAAGNRERGLSTWHARTPPHQAGERGRTRNGEAWPARKKSASRAPRRNENASLDVALTLPVSANQHRRARAKRSGPERPPSHTTLPAHRERRPAPAAR